MSATVLNINDTGLLCRIIVKLNDRIVASPSLDGRTQKLMARVKVVEDRMDLLYERSKKHA